MSLLELPSDIILNILHLSWKLTRDQIKNEKGRVGWVQSQKYDPYRSLILMNKEYNKRFSTTDILIPVVAGHSGRCFNKDQLIYIGRKLDIKLDRSERVNIMNHRIHDAIVKNKINDKGYQRRRKEDNGFRWDIWVE